VHKLVIMLRRRAGMSRQEFIDYYENHHSKIGEKHLKGGPIVKYMRRYLNPIPNPMTGKVDEPEYDALLEMWFKDVEQWTFAIGLLSKPDVMKLITEDEEKFLDRSRIRAFIVDERESDMR
jgi:EthD domain